MDEARLQSPGEAEWFVEVWFNHEGDQIKVERETLPKRGGARAELGSGRSHPPSMDANPGVRPQGNDKHGRAEPGKDLHGGEGVPSAAANQDAKMQDRGIEPDDNLQDTSIGTEIDTETRDKLGTLSAKAGAIGVASQDTAVSVPSLARLLELSFNEFETNTAPNEVAASLSGAGGVSSAVSLPASSSPVSVGADTG